MNNKVKIFGTLKDFNNNPICNGEIRIKDGKFNDMYVTKSDECGNYCLEVDSGSYMAIYGVKGYGVDNLEYWGWNLPAFEDLEINMRIDGLEVYGINAFMIQRTEPSMMIYFRPMSLRRGIIFKENSINANINDVINISPDLNIDDIDVKINNKRVNILEISKIKEKTSDGSQAIFGYLVQVSIPDGGIGEDYSKIHICLRDNVTNERGEGSLFWNKPKSFNYVDRV